MKITVLAENVSEKSNVASEHGLSLYIESGEKRILFDMGQSEIFSENAKVLGVDLSLVDFAVISHGHYDHGTGLARFLELNKTASVYINKDAFVPHFNGTEKYIGLDISVSGNERIVFTNSEISICKDVTLYPAVEDITNKFSSSDFFSCENGNFIPEDFHHEQYLMIEEKGKRVLFSGCSHRGITNIAKKFRPDVLIGGFHLSKFSNGELFEYASFLDKFHTDYYTCHCTGQEQYRFLKSRMKSINYLSCGQTLILE